MAQTFSSRSFWQTGAVADSGKPKKKGSRERRRMALFAFVVVVVAALTVLQKFCLPLSLGAFGGPVEVALPVTDLALLALAFFVKFKVDLHRVGAYVALLLAAMLSILLQKNAYSMNSVLLMFVIYTPFVLYIEISEKSYRKLLQIYLNVMIAAGAIVLVEQVAQLIWTWRVWPDLDTAIPQQFLMMGYVYIQPIKYGSELMKPNGIFFLEVSTVSQFTALALALELVYFRRTWRMVFYAIVLIACFAGTGLFLLLVTAPVLLSRLSRRSLAVMAAMFAAFVVTALAINWLPMVQQRFMEFQNYGSSSHHRFVMPFLVLFDLLKQPSSLFVGQGPGNIPIGNADVWWAATKLAFEYGFATMIAFFVFIGYVLFKGAPSQRIALVLIVFLNFSGGFIVPVVPLLVYLIGGMFRFRQSSAGEQDEVAPADIISVPRAAT